MESLTRRYDSCDRQQLRKRTGSLQLGLVSSHFFLRFLHVKPRRLGQGAFHNHNVYRSKLNTYILFLIVDIESGQLSASLPSVYWGYRFEFVKQ